MKRFTLFAVLALCIAACIAASKPNAAMKLGEGTFVAGTNNGTGETTITALVVKRADPYGSQKPIGLNVTYGQNTSSDGHCSGTGHTFTVTKQWTGLGNSNWGDNGDGRWIAYFKLKNNEEYDDVGSLNGEAFYYNDSGHYIFTPLSSVDAYKKTSSPPAGHTSPTIPATIGP